MGAGTGPARHRAVGEYGEKVAVRHLEASGLRVVDRNWRCDLGEVDIVAVTPGEPPTLVVCEVKTRTSTAFGGPLEQVTLRKAARLRRLAVRWLQAHPEVTSPHVRVDVVGVTVPRSGAAQVEHLEAVLS
ncbi:YraN family protein [Arsenicicoccus dermatophilus]|uniref:YraN family protein n=1 Tax=Arsenicicoccus dermatophilus TaxID=1076331 RepID=UPI003916E93C